MAGWLRCFFLRDYFLQCSVCVEHVHEDGAGEALSEAAAGVGWEREWVCAAEEAAGVGEVCGD